MALTTARPSLLRGARARALAVTVAALAACAALPPSAAALDLDPGFGAAGRGYVPVSAPETQVDAAVAIAHQGADKFVVLGGRLVAARGTLLLQRFSVDGTRDGFFGQVGTATIDVAGTSLVPRQLLVQDDGSLLVVAGAGDGLRIYALTPSGQPNLAFATGGELQLSLPAGAAAGTMSVHRVADNNFIVIAQNPGGANGSLTVTRYRASGVADDNFGLEGREVVSNLGAGLAYTGVATLLEDERIVVALAGPGAARALMLLESTGQADSANNGKPVAPAALQGKTITRLAPLSHSAFIAVTVSGADAGRSTELIRFDQDAHVDATFGAGGVLAVNAAGSGGGIAIGDLYETLDDDLVLTGTSNNGLVVARFAPNGRTDPVFNDGQGAVVIAEPDARATVGAASLQVNDTRIVHLGFAVLHGAPSSGALPARAFLVSTLQGRPDTSFGGSGIVNLFGRQAPASEYVEKVLPQADGRVMILSATGAGDGLLGTLSRYLADGSLDATYGAGGRVTFTLNGRCEWPLSVVQQADGAVVILGTSYNLIDCGTSAMFGRRFTAGGVPDTFPMFYGSVRQRARSGAIAIQADGRFVVTGQDDKSLVVARFLASGFADPSFATAGSLVMQPNAGDDAKGGAVLVTGDQKIVVAGSVNGVQLLLLQLNGDGSRDTQFGSNGLTLSSVPGNFLEVQALAPTPGGNLLVLARSGQRALLAQFHANGAPDSLFGVNGQLFLPLDTGVPQYAHFGLSVQSDGGIIVSGQTSADTTSAAALMRVTASGQVDPTFGTNGMQTLRPSVYYPAGANDVATASSGALYVGGYGIPGAFLARYGTAIAPATVLEFYNTGLNHYFITADPAEQAGIDAGAAGPGWTRTGNGFRAYLPALGLPAGTTPVCRFYGARDINPATGQRRGPNSHFYTAVAAECALVQLDPGWTLEGFAFYTRLPQSDGQCASGLVPVFRNYNKRAPFNDSNHRYTTDAGIYAQMHSLGWVGEGIAFCGAP